MPVALDEVAYMFGQFIALHIEPGLNFGSDILRNVLGPMFEGVENLYSVSIPPLKAALSGEAPR